MACLRIYYISCVAIRVVASYECDALMTKTWEDFVLVVFYNRRLLYSSPPLLAAACSRIVVPSEEVFDG